MKSRGFWMLGLAALFAAFAVVAAQRFIQRPAVVAHEPTTPVVVARLRMAYGTEIDRQHVRVVQWPTSTVPRGAFHKIADVVGGTQKRVALQAMEVDEPVLASKVSGFGGRATLATRIDKTMRAATIRVNDVNGVAGFVLPGDRVDVLLTRAPDASAGRGHDELQTNILLQNVKVLAIDQQSNVNKDKPSVARAVTLEVTPINAQKLILAQQVGKLSLALRNSSNHAAVDPAAVRVRDLGGSLPPAEPAAAPAPKPVVKRAPARVVRQPSVTVYRALKPFDYQVPSDRAPVSRVAPVKRTRSARPPGGNSGAGGQGANDPTNLVPSSRLPGTVSSVPRADRSSTSTIRD